MAIAIAIMMKDWETPQWVKEQITPMLAGVDIGCVPDIEPAEDIDVLICDKVPPGLVARLPNLKLLQKLGAGVESMVREPDLGPEVRIARVKSVSAARELVVRLFTFCAEGTRAMPGSMRKTRGSGAGKPTPQN